MCRVLSEGPVWVTEGIFAFFSLLCFSSDPSASKEEEETYGECSKNKIMEREVVLFFFLFLFSTRL